MKTGLYDVLRIEELRALAVATRLVPSVEELLSQSSLQPTSATQRNTTCGSTGGTNVMLLSYDGTNPCRKQLRTKTASVSAKQ